MNPIIEKQDLSENVVRMVLAAPDIARKRRAGQFIILKMDEKGERIPLTIVDSDEKAGTITIIQNGVWLTSLLGLDDDLVRRSLARTEHLALGG